jgi:hypothetical protein
MIAPEDVIVDQDGSGEQQPVAGLTVTPSAPSVSPGGEVGLRYTLQNTGAQNGTATSINISQRPGNWNVSSTDPSWRNGRESWISLDKLAPNETFTGNATVAVPEDANTEEYTISAVGNVTSDVGDKLTVRVTVSEGFDPSNYDTNGDGSVEGDLTGVLQALADYDSREIGLQQVLRIVAAYNGL